MASTNLFWPLLTVETNSNHNTEMLSHYEVGSTLAFSLCHVSGHPINLILMFTLLLALFWSPPIPEISVSSS